MRLEKIEPIERERERLARRRDSKRERKNSEEQENVIFRRRIGFQFLANVDSNELERVNF